MNEKEFELAAAVTSTQLENSLDRIKAQVKARDPNFDGYCNECGEQIPEARLDTGAQTCLDCQEILELRSKHALFR